MYYESIDAGISLSLCVNDEVFIKRISKFSELSTVVVVKTEKWLRGLGHRTC